MIHIKILSYKSPQRYAVRQTLIAAHRALLKIYPDLEIAVTDVKTLTDMEHYTPVVILPSLVVNEKLVCIGRFPKKDEVINWLQEVVEGRT
jgi:hypothetical protein